MTLLFDNLYRIPSNFGIHTNSHNNSTVVLSQNDPEAQPAVSIRPKRERKIALNTKQDNFMLPHSGQILQLQPQAPQRLLPLSSQLKSHTPI